MAIHDIDSVEVDRVSHVDVVFEDGLHAHFELGPLRLACPCADCNAKRQRGASVQPAVERGDPITISHAELAGAWGLNLDWSDGHSTGIYAWEKLREWVEDGIVGTVTLRATIRATPAGDEPPGA